jgi:hypothetical protein
MTRYVWADALNHAVRQVAGADGYSGTCLDRKPMSRAMLVGALHALSLEEREAILARFHPAAKQR